MLNHVEEDQGVPTGRQEPAINHIQSLNCNKCGKKTKTSRKISSHVKEKHVDIKKIVIEFQAVLIVTTMRIFQQE